MGQAPPGLYGQCGEKHRLIPSTMETVLPQEAKRTLSSGQPRGVPAERPPHLGDVLFGMSIPPVGVSTLTLAVSSTARVCAAPQGPVGHSSPKGQRLLLYLVCSGCLMAPACRIQPWGSSLLPGSTNFAACAAAPLPPLFSTCREKDGCTSG